MTIEQDAQAGEVDPGLRRAAALIGRRWTIELVGVLARGPQRFTDLKHAAGVASGTVLAGRLRELGEAGVVTREHLPPPAASAVYRLTERGAGLVPALDALARWGGTTDIPLPARGRRGA